MAAPMMVSPASHAARLALWLGSLSALCACERPQPPSPDVAAKEHQYEMGCLPEDAQGYERAMPYCNHHDLLDGGHD